MSTKVAVSKSLHGAVFGLARAHPHVLMCRALPNSSGLADLQIFISQNERLVTRPKFPIILNRTNFREVGHLLDREFATGALPVMRNDHITRGMDALGRTSVPLGERQ
jgi:hypothetical protein